MSDPGARINVIGGRYNLPGQSGVAYKMTGEYPHAIYFGFTTYDDLWQIPAANYVRNDRDIVPDAGSINPYIPGNLIAAPNRSYTLWMWPDNVPVPPDLQGNVIPYPTQPQDPQDLGARWSVAMRQYGVQPGFLPIQMTPKVTAYSTKTMQPVRCPLTDRGHVRVSDPEWAGQDQGYRSGRCVAPGARQHTSVSRAPQRSPGSGSMASLPTAVSVTSSGSCPRRSSRW